MTTIQLHQLASEEEARIVENVFLTQQRSRHAVVFVSPDRQAGCSWTVARLARSLARRVPGSVCIVDANLRWPSIHNLFWIDNTRGLLQALEESHPIRDYTHRIQDTNLWVLPSGGTVADSHASLASENVKSRIAELCSQFDFVLIDTLAMKASPDSGLLGQLANGAVLVLAAHSTNRETAMNAKLVLEAGHVPILGAVLNKRTYPVPDNIYRYL